jgi:hypothetical protein
MSVPGSVACDLCGSDQVRLVFSDHLRSTPQIVECGNPGCRRQEFRILRLRGRTVHCGAPRVLAPRSTAHSAVQQAQRERAMSNLAPPLDRAIRGGLLQGVEDV